MMYTERSKASKILEELIDYFFRNQINQMSMTLDYSEAETRIHIEGPCPEKPEDFERLYELLNEPRRPELEDYYYELLGGSVRHEELALLGSLIDKADMSYADQHLAITVYRNLQ